MALILLAASVALAPRLEMNGFVALFAVAAAAWLVLRHAALSLPLVLVVAVGLRVLLLFPEPKLSGDVYRYLWDGRVSASGVNPYSLAPDDERLTALRQPWHARINHAELRTIYPPHAQLLFAAVHELTPWRLLIITGDLLAIVLLRRRGLALAYATFPPLLFEGSWSGHIDALAAAFVALALLRDSGFGAGIAAGLKIIPGAAFPALVMRSKHRLRFAVAFFATLAIPFLPFVNGPLMPGFRDYATRWIFNSPLYQLVFAVVERIPTKELWTDSPLRFAAISDVVYRYVYPDFLTRVILATLALGGIALARKSVTNAIAALLICSPAIHPWYWLALAPSAMVERSAWLWVALCAPFSYLLYGGTPPLAVYALCYGIPLATKLLRPSVTSPSGAGWRLAVTRLRKARDTSPT